MTPRVLVAGVGNIFLGDDGFGSEAARRLASVPLPEGVTVTDYGIRGMHLAYDLLAGYDTLVVLDAVPRGGTPGDIVVLEVGEEDFASGGGADAASVGAAGPDLDAHGMEPTAVLAGLGSLGGRLPRTLVVGCEPAAVGEQIGLSAPVAAAVERAVDVVTRLVTDGSADRGNAGRAGADRASAGRDSGAQQWEEAP
jgi:hydrogenase maturation protease